MSDLLARIAAELGEEPLHDDEVEALLDLARDVAHQSERKSAPLASFLAGIAVGRADGPRAVALTDVAARVRSLLLER